ncbi:MAG: hypothetical protein AAGM36_10760, partial [Cyanobacteria bacterium J06597_1]
AHDSDSLDTLPTPFSGSSAWLYKLALKLVDLAKKLLDVQGIQAKSDFFSKPYLASSVMNRWSD